MRYRRLLLISLLGFGLALLAGCTPDNEFKLNFTQGAVIRYIQTVDTNISSTILNAPFNLTQHTVIHVDQEVISANENGSHSLQQTIRRIVFDIQAGVFKFDYDSDQPEKSKFKAMNTMGALIGIPIQITVNPKGDIVELSGKEKMLEVLEDTPLGKFAARENSTLDLTNIIDDQLSSGPAGMVFFPLPGKKVKVGESWVRHKTFTYPRIGSVEYDETLLLTEVNDHMAKIISTPVLTGEMFADKPDSPDEGALLGAAKIKEVRIDGIYLFDMQKGRLDRQVQTVDMDVEMVGFPKGKLIPVRFHTQQVTEVAK